MSRTSLRPPSSFKGDWVTPNHAEYNAATLRWTRNSRDRISVVAFARDVSDVASVISYACAYELPVAIRGGGHNAAGASSSGNGVVIDLSRHMNDVRIDVHSGLVFVRVSGGALWKDVDRVAMGRRLTAIGETINLTGIGGAIGLELVVDNLVEVTIVKADGSIFTASEQENVKLFQALLHRRCNFGVVTEFVYLMHPQRATVFCGNVRFSGKKLPAIMNKLETWWEGGPSPKCSILLFITVSPDGRPANILSLFYNGSEAEGRAYFKPFFDIGPIDDMTKEMPFEAVHGIQSRIPALLLPHSVLTQNERLVHGVNNYVKRVFTSRLCTSNAVMIQKRTVELARGTSILPAFMLELCPSEKMLSFKCDSTSFLRWKGVNNLVMTTWPDDADEEQEKAKRFVHELCSIASTSDDMLSASENTGYGNHSAYTSSLYSAPTC
ncbi:hypothetical protein K488DRAFT_51559 [Vararia minispora EC-137]|uniref:Uncharacterized protein n=1 Tax=Vararia minispora EC-137 TaxID=1314806 RepID=A0ACB8QJ98_9AGAM|nr:hypothetical protein K488DRAFT_51559 [Vararia minispora EC-137]